MKIAPKETFLILFVFRLDSFITTKLKWSEKTDILLEPESKNRLKKTSLIRTNKLATLDIELVIGKLGELSSSNLNELNIKLKKVLALK